MFINKHYDYYIAILNKWIKMYIIINCKYNDIPLKQPLSWYSETCDIDINYLHSNSILMVHCPSLYHTTLLFLSNYISNLSGWLRVVLRVSVISKVMSRVFIAHTHTHTHTYTQTDTYSVVHSNIYIRDNSYFFLEFFLTNVNIYKISQKTVINY